MTIHVAAVSSETDHSHPMVEKARRAETLRVAFIAGVLAKGGSETQLVHWCRSLVAAGVDVRVFSFTRGEVCEALLKESGVPVIWVGESKRLARRLWALYQHLRTFRPHVLQSVHFYTNAYTAILARLVSAEPIGCVRSDLYIDLTAHPRLGRLLLHGPSTLVVNSRRGLENCRDSGVNESRLHLLPNVLDLSAYRDRDDDASSDRRPLAVALARLRTEKRIDRFVRALALARKTVPELGGAIIGDGPQEQILGVLASELGLGDDSLKFLGQRHDIPDLLAAADMLVLTSEHEGFPNVIMEAMAAGLPVLSTPVGDAVVLVEDGVNGFIVPHEDVGALADRMVQLARDPELARRMGAAGRQRALREFSAPPVALKLLTIYRAAARRRGNSVLASAAGAAMDSALRAFAPA